jgi:hypothetical protein
MKELLLVCAVLPASDGNPPAFVIFAVDKRWSAYNLMHAEEVRLVLDIGEA